MMPVSVVILTKNSERTIQQCLEAVKDLSDDIVIWDSLSQDNTLKIASSYTKNIWLFDDHSWKLLGKYGKTKMRQSSGERVITDGAGLKNLAVSKAKHDWIFSLDSDEIVTPQLSASIREAITNKNINGYYIKRKDYTFLNTYICTIPILRLYRKSKGKFRHRVHETVSVEGETPTLKGHMNHFSVANVADYINRLNFHTNIEAVRMAENNTYNLFKLLFQLATRPVFEFGFWYFYRGLWRRGLGGLFYSLTSSFYQVVKYLKFVEKVTFSRTTR